MNQQQQQQRATTLASQQLHSNPAFFAYPESDDIEPERAKFLYEQHCAILILLDLPLASEFGLDLFAHRIGRKFKGVKLIPPGVHFVYASAIEHKQQHSAESQSNPNLSNQQCGPRCGFIYNFKPKEVVIKKWSASEEDFDDSYQASQEECLRYQANLRDLDPYLAAYRYSSYKKYSALINKLTPDVVQALNPTCNRLRSIPYLIRDTPADNDNEKSSSSDDKKRARFVLNEETLLPHLKPDESTVIHFTKIPINHTDSKQAISHDMITHYNLDTTLKLEHTFKGQAGRERLLGEFQFAFITFILYHIYDCFEHWKRLLALVCLADSGLAAFPQFFRQFLQILASQMDYIPEDLFEDIVDSNNLVRCQLDSLFQNISGYSLSDEINTKELNDLKEFASLLRGSLESKFGWQFELEPEDEQPVVVDL